MKKRQIGLWDDAVLQWGEAAKITVEDLNKAQAEMEVKSPLSGSKEKLMKHKIEWLNPPGYTGATWNPIAGCTHAGSAGCDNCYAARTAHSLSTRFGSEKYHGLARKAGKRHAWTGNIHIADEVIKKPLIWRKPRFIFCISMGDLFHDVVMDVDRSRVMETMRNTPQHRYIILTKRPENAREYFRSFAPAPENLILGLSVADHLDMEKVDILTSTDVNWRCLSYEPAIGPLNLNTFTELTGIDWFIAGGETGPVSRPSKADYFRQSRDWCHAHGIPFFFKQWGDHDENGQKVGKATAGRMLEGVLHDYYPTAFLSRHQPDIA